jgi:hypothetical protein
LKPIRVFVLGFSALLLFCTLPKIMVRPDYRTMNAGQASLGIVVISQNIRIKNPNDVVLYLGEKKLGDFYGSIFSSLSENPGAASTFCSYFADKFPAIVWKWTEFRSVSFAAAASRDSLTIVQQALPNGKPVPLLLPDRQHYISDTLNYLLIIEQMETDRVTAASTDLLICKGVFSLWDNERGTLAAWGGFQNQVDAVSRFTRQTWAELLGEVGRSICARQPWGSRSGRQR